MQKIIIIGRLVRDTELSTSQNATEFCRFTVAVDRRATKDGKKEADFFNCTAFGKTGVFVNKFFRKGDGIILTGRMENNKYKDKDGNDRTGWGLSVEEVTFPPTKRSDNSATNSDGQGSVPDSNLDNFVVNEEELPF